MRIHGTQPSDVMTAGPATGGHVSFLFRGPPTGCWMSPMAQPQTPGAVKFSPAQSSSGCPYSSQWEPQSRVKVVVPFASHDSSTFPYVVTWNMSSLP
jgi:hypothetical protein